jgi:DNA-directed RNA polymerase subunit RPC12/RpoP
VRQVIAAALRRPQTLSGPVWKVLNAILRCRTPALGAHHYRCADCGREHLVPHSCRNRHCPECQGAKAREWLDQQMAHLLPVAYFHVVFTLPHSLNALIAQNPRVLHTLLFSSVSATLLEFAANKHGVRPGITTVLHTWGQNLLDHHHLHCLATGGGLSPDGQRWKTLQANYLFPVRALSKVFRAKYLGGLRALFQKGELEFHGRIEGLADPDAFIGLLREACRSPWSVYAKRPFAGPRQVLAYLSRYTHRTAIGNRRILALNPGAETVTFSYKDYADGSRRKAMTLGLSEFLRRFCLHILPPRFVKIRHYGLLANQGRAARIARARELIGDPPAGLQSAPQTTPSEEQSAEPVVACPHCGSSRLTLLGILPPITANPEVPRYSPPDTS